MLNLTVAWGSKDRIGLNSLYIIIMIIKIHE